MALALYRKYRPATFGEVVGQEHVTEPLRTALGAGRINHAYLFSGPRGCGKTSSARILARSLNCAQGPTADPCGECDSCAALAPEGGGSVDVIELDAASHGGVDDTRELRDRAVFAPASSRYRIFVIDEAHMVTPQGFNALLKIVEEPPEHLIFVFATTEPDKVLTTIRSRTHHYPFRLVPPGSLRALLERVCGEEGVRVEPAVYPLAIRAGGGSVRDTLSVLDQLLAGAGAEGITYERAVALLGVTDVALIDEMVDGLAVDDGAAVYGTVDRLVEAGHDPRRFASDLLDRLRDLVLLRSVPDAGQRGLVDATDDELARMRSQAERFGAAGLSRFADIVHNGLSEMRGATAPRLLLELLCARMMLPAVSGDESALLQRLERVENRMTIAPPPSAPAAGGSAAAVSESAVPSNSGDTSEPVADSAASRRVFQRPHERAAQQAAEPAPEQRSPDSAPSERPAPVASAPPEPPAPSESSEPAVAEEGASEGDSGGFNAADVRRVWTELLRAVAERNKPTQALLLNATVQDLREGTLVLSMPTSGLLKQFAQQRRIEVVRDAMRAVVGGEWDVQCVEAGATPPPDDRGGRSGGGKPETAPRQARPAQRPEEQARPETQQRPAAERPRANSETEDSAPRDAVPAERKPASEDNDRDGIPPPPEPPDEEPPPEDAAPAVPAASVERSAPEPTDDSGQGAPAPSQDTAASRQDPPTAEYRDSQEVAFELLASELGARRIDDK
ncbi:DNA polymerase-3 subunit gamma/tau [Saccharopolyspora lacisalsi]|uniref:DNA polymerase III subunit gamma/tau n=1 Tax=Halosaccharopolyspora lacisalsi TaxID=1000566 RepID=A0A839E6V1_9PSEU|nr:DNA polymerase III subunit gamma and tau [Halosaccharopolyspora lacisalsi]MBA8827427.1 DNA polymerase-3 subunit gamma/tau [Halosaccharopolyspora lacisalsi]